MATSNQLTKAELFDKAMNIVLSCPVCRLPNDTVFDKNSSEWRGYCECGKVVAYDSSYAIAEAKEILKTLSKKRK
jgi:hypothetical protein